jgi:hypothetical protein
MTYPVMFKINTMQNNRLYFDFVKIYKEMAEKTNNDFDITIFHKIMQHKYDLLLALLEAGEKIPALLDIIPSESVSYTNYFGLLSLSSTNDYYEFDTIREDYYQRIVR